jgi:Putative beta-barrel porin-2, OmpL-like. bbp2
MTLYRRLASFQRARAAFVSALVASLYAGPSAAQEVPVAGPSVDPSNVVKVEAAAYGTAQQTQASQDDGITAFFRNTELSGFVDTYYGYNFNKPTTGLTQLRNFDVQHNSFSLNLAELSLNKVPTADSRGGFRLDLDYGPTQDIVNAAEPGGTSIFRNIGQVYLSYLAPTRKGLQLDIGKFVTPHGAEVIKTKDNWNYSRSLLFALAIPYYHMGVRVTYPFTDKFTFAGYVVNGWNNVVDNNTGKTIGLQAVIKPAPAVTIVQNYMGGSEQTNADSNWRHLSDTTVTYDATSKLSFNGNYDYGQDKVAGATVKWQGVAGYLKVQPNSWFAFAPRAEYYQDKNGFTTGTTQKVKEVTLTGEIKHRDGVVMRIEYRRDFSNIPFFLKTTTETIKKQDTVTVGFIYAFNSTSR